MATTEAKKSVTTTVEVGIKDNTMKELEAARLFVGAPTTARVTINYGPGPYPVAEGEEEVEILPYKASFTWTEDK